MTQRRQCGIPNGRLTLTVEETANLIGIARTTAYECIRTGAIPAIRLGRRILVPAHYLDEVSGEESPYGLRVTGPAERQLNRLPEGTAAAIVMLGALVDNPQRLGGGGAGSNPAEGISFGAVLTLTPRVSDHDEVDLRLSDLAQRTKIRPVRSDDFIAVGCLQNNGRINHI